MCGILGFIQPLQTPCKISYTYDTIQTFISVLQKLQHRGQDGWGISFLESCCNLFQTYHQFSVIPNCKPLLNLNLSKQLQTIIKKKPLCCIGQIRYSTELSQSSKLQPIHGKTKFSQSFYIVHNGNIPGITIHDTIFIKKCLEQSIYYRWEDKCIDIMNTIPASYSLLIMTTTTMWVLRDRYGIRPLFIGTEPTTSNLWISSETCIFSTIIPEITSRKINWLEVKAGSIHKLSFDGTHQQLYQYNESNYTAKLCLFELIYLLHPTTILNNRTIDYYRSLFGKTLAQQDHEIKQLLHDLPPHHHKSVCVVGVPSSGISSAKGYARELGITYVDAIHKRNTLTKHRSFLEPTQQKRTELAQSKFIIDHDKLMNKYVIVIDDSLIRGTVINSLLTQLNKCNLAEIYIRIPSPPVISICQLGIAIRNQDELLIKTKPSILQNKQSYHQLLQSVSNDLGITSLLYLPLPIITKILQEYNISIYAESFGQSLDSAIQEWIFI